MIARAKMYLIAGAAVLAALAGAFWIGWVQRGSWEREKRLEKQLETRREVDRIETDVQKLDDDALADRLSDPRGMHPR